jgi:hypothetical protein
MGKIADQKKICCIDMFEKKDYYPKKQPDQVYTEYYKLIAFEDETIQIKIEKEEFDKFIIEYNQSSNQKKNERFLTRIDGFQYMIHQYSILQ